MLGEGDGMQDFGDGFGGEIDVFDGAEDDAEHGAAPEGDEDDLPR